jgi:hypothetical protein
VALIMPAPMSNTSVSRGFVGERGIVRFTVTN